MRTDCKRDNRKCLLPNASTLGFGLYYAKRGNWIYYNEPGTIARHGRVLGRVHADGKTYIEAIVLFDDLTCAGVRWIEPASVLVCNAEPPAKLFAFMCDTDWNKRAPLDIIETVDSGFKSFEEFEAWKAGVRWLAASSR